jgi:hypothetical protein
MIVPISMLVAVVVLAIMGMPVIGLMRMIRVWPMIMAVIITAGTGCGAMGSSVSFGVS